MTSAIPISGSQPAGFPPFGQAQSSSATAASGGQEFNVLLGILASLMVSGGTAVPAANQGENCGNPTIQNTTGSASPSVGTTPVSVEQQLAGVTSSGDQPPSQGQSSGSQSNEAAAYMAAAFPFISPYQIFSTAQNQSSSASGIEQPTGEITSAILQKIEQDVSALLSAGQTSSSEGSAVSSPVNIAQQTGNESSSSTNAAPQSQEAAVNAAMKADLLKVLSAASAGNTDTNASNELSSLVDKLDGGSAASLQDLIRKLNDGSAADALKQWTSPLQPGSSGSSTTPTSLQAPALAQELNSATAYGAKTGSQNSAAAPTQTIVPGTVNSSANTSITPAAVPVADQSTASANASATTGSQAANNLDVVATGQSSPIQTSQPGQGNQSPSDSGKDFSDLLKMGASQVYANAVDGSKGDVSFKQTLSSAAQNQPAAPAYPSVDRLTQSIVKEVNLMNQDGKTVVNMKLEPDSLGSVTLQVSSENGKISAQFNVRTTDARTYLESSVPQMKQMLESNGVSLSHLTVSLSSGESQSKNAQYQYRPKKQQTKYYDAQTAAAAAVSSPELSRSFGYNTMEMKV